MTNMIQNPSIEIDGVTMGNAKLNGSTVEFTGGSTPSWVQFDLTTPMVGGNTYTLTLSLTNLTGGVSPQVRLPAGAISSFYNLSDGENVFTCRSDLDDYSVLRLMGSGSNVTAHLSSFSLTA